MKIPYIITDCNTISSSDPLRNIILHFYSLHWKVLHIYQRKGAPQQNNFLLREWSGL